MSQLDKLVGPWLLTDDNSDDLIYLRDQLIWLKNELFDEYEPNIYESFDDCLARWLMNVSDEDTQIRMFRLLNHLFFVGKQQLDSLSRSAFSDQICRWLLNEKNLDITNSDLTTLINQAVHATWFCPITDSLRINGFLKVNHLIGHDHRPDWRSLKKFGDPLLVRNFVQSEGIEQLVLIEDFVGSGTQMESAVTWASKTLPNVKILVIPLICCPNGVKKGELLAKKHENVSFDPCLSLRPELFVQKKPQAGEPKAFADIRSVIETVHERLGDHSGAPYGYRSTGALVALYSNCPNNTLPLVHAQSDTWNPLFSRIRRS